MGKPIEFDAHPYKYNANPPTYRFACRRVIDGDTFEGWVDFGLRSYDWREVRLRGVDTPEIFKPRNAEELAHGIAAKAYVERKILRIPLIVRTLRDVATYDRFEAEVYFYAPPLAVSPGVYSPAELAAMVAAPAEPWRSLADAIRAAGYEKRAEY